MKIWPANSFDIHTALSPEKVFEALEINVEPKKLFWINREHKYFQGTFSKEGFKLTRIIHYRNSFLPRISGSIAPEGAGSVVKIKMNLHPLVIAFMAVWFGGVIIASVAVIIAFITHSSRANPGMLVPLGMLIFGIALVSGGFWFEAPKQQEKLIAILQG